MWRKRLVVHALFFRPCPACFFTPALDGMQPWIV
jgi:hypothetical protein